MAVAADVLFGASGLTGVVVGNRVATRLIRRHRARPHQRTPAEIQAHIEALEIDLGMRRACVECSGSTAAGFFGRETAPVCRTCYQAGCHQGEPDMLWNGKPIYEAGNPSPWRQTYLIAQADTATRATGTPIEDERRKRLQQRGQLVNRPGQEFPLDRPIEYQEMLREARRWR